MSQILVAQLFVLTLRFPFGASTFKLLNGHGVFASSLGGLELCKALVGARTGQIALNAPLLVKNVIRRHSELKLYWSALCGINSLLGAVSVRRRVHLVFGRSVKTVMGLRKAV